MTIYIQQLMEQVERTSDSFHEAVYRSRDLDAAMALTAADCELVNLPIGTAARGERDLRRYLAEDVLPHIPADVHFRRMSRTGDRWRIVHEAVIAFTHDVEMPWLLPTIAPTFRAVEVHMISVVAVHRARITVHRTLWDHHSLCAQLAEENRRAALTG